MQKFGILMSVVLCLPLSLVAQVGGAMPAGSGSVTTTPVALVGPLLWAVTVNVTLLPTFGDGLFTVFVTATSAEIDTVVDAEEESFELLGSKLPPTA